MEKFASFIPLLLLLVVMYFLMIRPQKKKDKQVQDMRNSLQVGDEIITIGGICGKIVKTKDETIVIQVGADKVKFEMMRWAVSTVKNAVERPETPEKEEEAHKKILPKRLKKTADVEEETDAVKEEPTAEEKTEE